MFVGPRGAEQPADLVDDRVGLFRAVGGVAVVRDGQHSDTGRDTVEAPRRADVLV